MFNARSLSNPGLMMGSWSVADCENAFLVQLDDHFWGPMRQPLRMLSFVGTGEIGLCGGLVGETKGVFQKC